MKHRLVHAHARLLALRHVFSEEAVALVLALVVFVAPAAAATRLQQRSLVMQSAVPGATTSYTISFRYETPETTGSVDMLFCIDPIPYMPCVTPPGLDVSGATLSSQSGETGYSISTQSANHIVLSRTPSMISPGAMSSYTLTGIKNPTDTSEAFSIRLATHVSTDASGPQIDFGSVRGEVTSAITIQAQVPPMLIFCVGQVVYDNCAGTNNVYYSDMGQLTPTGTLTAQSQMAVGTNASGGFAITTNGGPPAAGTNVINSPATPAKSEPGTDQFGINLVANNSPSVGSDPEGTFANAVPSPDYATPNRYKYTPGDIVAFSPNVSLMKKFTVSYILNSSPDLRAGVYTTTITYVASGRF